MSIQEPARAFVIDQEWASATPDMKLRIADKRFAIAHDKFMLVLIEGMRDLPRVDSSKASARAAMSVLVFHLGNDPELDIEAVTDTVRMMTHRMRAKIAEAVGGKPS
jgi:hypothetical protein